MRTEVKRYCYEKENWYFFLTYKPIPDMKKRLLFFLLLVFIYPFILQAQTGSSQKKNSNQEFEFSPYFLGSNYSEFGAHFLYRRSMGKSFKVGAGLKLALGSLNDPTAKLQPGVLFEISSAIGFKRNWSVYIQPGYSFFQKSDGPWSGYDPVKGFYDYDTERKMGFTFLLGVNYRIKISDKVSLLTGAFNSYQHVRTLYYREYQSNPGQIEADRWNKLNFGGGIRVGIVF
jgi:hypothetical protein